MAYESTNLASANLNIGSPNSPQPLQYGGAPVGIPQKIETQPKPTAQTAPTTQIGSTTTGGAGLYGANQANLQQLLNLAKPTLDNNNKLVDEKNKIYKHLYSAPLTDEEKKALTPSTKLAIESGQRQLIDAQIKAINNQLQGYVSGIDNSISDYMGAIAKMQESRDNIAKNIASNPQLAGLYGADTLKSMGINAAAVGVGVVGGYDMGNYATNPNNVNQLNQIYNSPTMQAVGNDAQSIQNYINQYAPNSPITGQMIMDVSQKTGVDAKMLLTVAQNESQFGTAGVAARTFNPGNVGNVDSGGTRNMGSWENGLMALAHNLSGRYVGSGTSSGTDEVTQSYVDGIANGTITSIAQVPKEYKSKVAVEMSKQGISSPIADSRFTMASSRITAPYKDMAAYKLTADGQVYLDRIAAAMDNPGSVSDQDLLDSLTKLNTGGNAISDAQVRLITDGRSFSDAASVYQNKLSTGGVLSDTQRQQILKIATGIFRNYLSSYQPIYEKASEQLKGAGIPEDYWTIPDLNNLLSDNVKKMIGQGTIDDEKAKNLIQQTTGSSQQQGGAVWYNPFTWF